MGTVGGIFGISLAVFIISAIAANVMTGGVNPKLPLYDHESNEEDDFLG